ncbi:alpha-1,6-mannanase [Dysgonomonas sp. BGC7]|nr:alpha-1,6-mannanase [Dysgonomonas sp. BGC7]
MKKLLFLILIPIMVSCNKETIIKLSRIDKAYITLDSLYNHYQDQNNCLLYETFPYDNDYKAGYLAQNTENHSQYAYLWPYSGTLSAINAILESKNDEKSTQLLNGCVLVGLEKYFDTNRPPSAYASYINTAAMSDRFYDDNVWLGIDFADIYQITKNPKYLDKAKLIWEFIVSGTDDKLGGGIYWCEQKKESKNTCSNAPGSVLAFKLFQTTEDSTYFYKGKELYEWTKLNLQDADFLYFDNINLEGKVNKAKYAYNSGQMLQSAALQYKLTQDSIYLTEAQNIAKACYDHFFTDFTTDQGDKFHMIKKGNVWFTAVMLRGFIELYKIDNNRTYIDAFDKSLDYAWLHSRDNNGLFNVDLSGKEKDEKKWLLTQAAIVEMYARLAILD